jgi:predicted CopG family antitoxin
MTIHSSNETEQTITITLEEYNRLKYAEAHRDALREIVKTLLENQKKPDVQEPFRATYEY